MDAPERPAKRPRTTAPDSPRPMAATELVLYMVWRKTWLERTRAGVHDPIHLQTLFDLLPVTAEFLGLEVKLPDLRQYLVIIDRLWTRGVLVVRPVDEEAFVSVTEGTGQEMEASLRKAAAGENGKFQITDPVRDMHAQFVCRSIWTALGKVVSQEQIAGLMKQAAGPSASGP